MKQTSEAAFETAIEAVLLNDGYSKLASGAFDAERAIFPDEALAFIRETQSQDLGETGGAARRGDRRAGVAGACKWLDTHGALATLRHGFKCFGKTLRIAFFRPAHGLNPELEARYRANRLGITRQLLLQRQEQKIAGCGAVGQRHSGGDAGAEEPAHRPDGGQRHPPVPPRPRPARADLRSLPSAPWCISPWIPKRRT